MKKTTNKSSFVAKVATNFLLALLFCVGISQFIEINPMYGAIGLIVAFSAIEFVGKLANLSTGKFAFMALQTEVWVDFIAENLFSENLFMSRCQDDSQYVSHLTVHLPQAGANPSIYKDNTSLPISINQRTDTDYTYSLHNYKAEPILITNLESLQISYNKMQSATGNYIKTIGNTVAEQTLYSWAPSGASRIVRTSGSAVATALAPSATGTRKAITLLDITAAKAILDKDKVPMEGRILVMDSDTYNNQLLQISNIQQFYAYNLPVTQTGKVPTLFGFEVMVRPSVLVYDTTPVPKTLNGDGTVSGATTTDNLAALAYHPDFVRKALGAIIPHYQENNPAYYGPIFSMEVNHGANPSRSTLIGVVAIVQTT